MKTFLKLTCLFEALTGISLIIAPKLVVQLLFETTLKGTGGILSAMIAGSAILSITLMYWLTKEIATAYLIVKALLFYNISVVAILFYGMLNYNIKGLGLWLVVLFHSVFAIWGFILVKSKNPLKTKNPFLTKRAF